MSDLNPFERAYREARAVEARALLGDLLHLALVSAVFGVDHPRVQSSLVECRPRLDHLCDADGWTHLSLDLGAVMIGGSTIPLGDPKALRLHAYLAPLGIAEIAIHRDVSDEAIHDLFGTIARRLRSLSQGSGLEESHLQALPETIRVTRCEPNTPVTSAHSTRYMRSLLREAASRLQVQGDAESTDGDRNRIARQALSAVLQRTANSAAIPQFRASEEGIRGLEQVLDFCTSAMRENLGNLLCRQYGVDELRGALRASEIAAALASDRDSMSLVLDVLHEAWPTLGQKKAVPFDARGGALPNATFADLPSLVAELEVHATRPPQLRFEEQELRAETASILMHLLGEAQPKPELLWALQHRLRAALRPPIPEPVFTLLDTALRCALREGRSQEIERSLPVLLESFHHASSRMAWEFLIKSLETAESVAAQELLSPHVVAWLERNGGPTAAGQAERLEALLAEEHIQRATAAQRRAHA